MNFVEQDWKNCEFCQSGEEKSRIPSNRFEKIANLANRLKKIVNLVDRVRKNCKFRQSD